MNNYIMVGDAFDDAFNRLEMSEGGYSNDPNDPGGETKYGISKRSYPHLDIAALTLDVAKEIYRRDFWAPFEGFPSILRFQLFDFGVNSGVSTAIRHLQTALGVAPDGEWGPVSQTALDARGQVAASILLAAERLDFMTKCSVWNADSRGLTRRMVRNLRYAVTL